MHVIKWMWPISPRLKIKLWFHMTSRFKCIECNKYVFYSVKEKWARKLILFFKTTTVFLQWHVAPFLKIRVTKGGGEDADLPKLVTRQFKKSPFFKIGGGWIAHHIFYNFYIYVKFIYNFNIAPSQKEGGQVHQNPFLNLEFKKNVYFEKKIWGSPPHLTHPVRS